MTDTSQHRDAGILHRAWTRRQFLARGVAAVAAALATGVLGKIGWLRWKRSSVHPRRVRRPGRVLTEHEFATLETLADIIAPSDEVLPGARDVEAAMRVEDRLMRRTYDLDRYRQGLRWLDQVTAQVYGAGTLFVDLSREQQVALLKRIEATARQLRRPVRTPWDLPWRYWDRLMVTLFGFGYGVFFLDVVREDVLEAVYSHPKTWVALGYDGPPQPLGYWNGANGNWNIIDDCPPTKRRDFPPATSHRGGGDHG